MHALCPAILRMCHGACPPSSSVLLCWGGSRKSASVPVGGMIAVVDESDHCNRRGVILRGSADWC